MKSRQIERARLLIVSVKNGQPVNPSVPENDADLSTVQISSTRKKIVIRESSSSYVAHAIARRNTMLHVPTDITSMPPPPKQLESLRMSPRILLLVSLVSVQCVAMNCNAWSVESLAEKASLTTLGQLEGAAIRHDLLWR